jgi:hypothetical protein
LKLKYDEAHSNLDFNLNLRRYTADVSAAAKHAAPAAAAAAKAGAYTRSRQSST